MTYRFSKTVSAGTRVYFFDVRTDTKGQPYVTITEQSRDGKRRSSVFLHREYLGEFKAALAEAIDSCQ